MSTPFPAPASAPGASPRPWRASGSGGAGAPADAPITPSSPSVARSSSVRAARAGRAGRVRGGRTAATQVEELALVAQAARAPLLRVHRAWLRREDLEDCYGQAVLELLAQARRGELRCAGPRQLRRALELRFLSRVHDRRRALRGRSPAQALLDGALVHDGDGSRAADVADPRADVERRALLRFELRSVQLAARRLSHDQRLVLACQLAGQMDAAEVCGALGWSREKQRKVAQRARAVLRREVQELAERPDVPL